MTEDILISSAREQFADGNLDSKDSVAWLLAMVMCRHCWHPWWRHGHGPFSALVDAPTTHLFDAL